ncbi:acyltransferase family protein [Macrococcus animalis]|uniref:acyltransferase family protein n=1 Tax=Macrococcus animalis TaxID=3395467 RepID=UPI0039BEC75B
MEKIELQKKFRPEIEGLRFIAALLVAIYHIWFQKVSGGVDVFFVISGFLITISLINQINRTGNVSFRKFFGGLLTRLLPVATLGLLFVAIVTYFFYPQIYKENTFNEIIASLFYFENWQLALNSVDYLNQSEYKSPVQHYWAMSIQGQFYLIWFLLFYLLNRFVFRSNIKKNTMILLTLFIILFISSFIYSVYLTNTNQAWAYFDVRTRVWEFALGGIVALLIDKIKFPQLISAILSWLGLTCIILLGFLFDVSTLFPGYIALIPTLSAVFIMISGNKSNNYGAEKLLSNKHLMRLGGFSFSIYLWHWILLTVYKTILNHEINLINGMIILVSSIMIAYLLTEYVEKPLRSNFLRPKFRWSYFTLIAIVITSICLYYKFETMNALEIAQKHNGNLGAAAINTGVINDDNKPYYPQINIAQKDLAKSYKDKCNNMGNNSRNISCEYGATKNYQYTIALVGGSHSAHWLGALESFAKQDKIRIVNITKSDCRFSTDKQKHQSCNNWNETIIDKIVEVNPDLVFTTVDVSNGVDKEIPRGFINQFNKLENHNIKIFGVRDNPRLKVNIPECLERNKQIDQCSFKKSDYIISPSPWDKLSDKPTNVIYHDYSDYFCTDEKCLPVIGNTIIYIDREHITQTYMRTLGPLMRQDILNALHQVNA